MKRIDLPTITRVQDGRIDLVEPPLDPNWTEAEKLAWHAATVAHDTCLHIQVREDTPGRYALIVGHVGTSAMPMRDAWSYLNGIRAAARRPEADGTTTTPTTTPTAQRPSHP